MTRKPQIDTAPLSHARNSFTRGAAVVAAGALAFIVDAKICLAGENAQTRDAPDSNSARQAGTNSPSPIDAWKTIHTIGPDGVTESTAILRVADALRSDPRFAGLMLQCGKQGVEPVVVVVAPFPPQSRPKITLRADDQAYYFDGMPLAAGSGVRIETDGRDFLNGLPKGVRELAIDVADGGSEIRGVVQLSGLTNAIRSLADCADK